MEVLLWGVFLRPRRMLMRQCLSHCLLPDRLLGQHKATQPNNPKSTDLSQPINLNKAQDTSQIRLPCFSDPMSHRSVSYLEWLDSMILGVFSSLSDSMILCSSPGQGPVEMIHTVDLQPWSRNRSCQTMTESSFTGRECRLVLELTCVLAWSVMCAWTVPADVPWEIWITKQESNSHAAALWDACSKRIFNGAHKGASPSRLGCWALRLGQKMWTTRQIMIMSSIQKTPSQPIA